jgi:hypothetical protein
MRHGFDAPETSVVLLLRVVGAGLHRHDEGYAGTAAKNDSSNAGA